LRFPERSFKCDCETGEYKIVANKKVLLNILNKREYKAQTCDSGDLVETA